jgi:Zinc-binding dehydrogenase
MRIFWRSAHEIPLPDGIEEVYQDAKCSRRMRGRFLAGMDANRSARRQPRRLAPSGRPAFHGRVIHFSYHVEVAGYIRCFVGRGRFSTSPRANVRSWGKSTNKPENRTNPGETKSAPVPGTLAQSLDAVRVGGQISLVGVLTGLQGEVSTVALLGKQARLQGLMVGSRRQQQDYVAALEQTGVRPILDSSFSLDQLANAFRYQASGAHFGKVAIEW